MSESQITKWALANSMKVLMQKRPMKKISISDIVEGCNMNRQSFYYHFKDKYDLVNWIYYTEFIVTIKDLQATWEFLESICDYFYENKIFYKNAFDVKAITKCPETAGNFCPLHDINHVQIRPWGSAPNPGVFRFGFPERVM